MTYNEYPVKMKKEDPLGTEEMERGLRGFVRCLRMTEHEKMK